MRGADIVKGMGMVGEAGGRGREVETISAPIRLHFPHFVRSLKGE